VSNDSHASVTAPKACMFRYKEVLGPRIHGTKGNNPTTGTRGRALVSKPPIRAIRASAGQDLSSTWRAPRASEG
jgi:hypothetical protein